MGGTHLGHVARGRGLDVHVRAAGRRRRCLGKNTQAGDGSAPGMTDHQRVPPHPSPKEFSQHAALTSSSCALLCSSPSSSPRSCAPAGSGVRSASRTRNYPFEGCSPARSPGYSSFLHARKRPRSPSAREVSAMNCRPHMKTFLSCSPSRSARSPSPARPLPIPSRPRVPTGWTWDDGALVSPDGWTWDDSGALISPDGWTWDESGTRRVAVRGDVRERHLDGSAADRLDVGRRQTLRCRTAGRGTTAARSSRPPAGRGTTARCRNRASARFTRRTSARPGSRRARSARRPRTSSPRRRR